MSDVESNNLREHGNARWMAPPTNHFLSLSPAKFFTNLGSLLVRPFHRRKTVAAEGSVGDRGTMSALSPHVININPSIPYSTMLTSFVLLIF